jgi:hypothetical protein
MQGEVGGLTGQIAVLKFEVCLNSSWVHAGDYEE